MTRKRGFCFKGREIREGETFPVMDKFSLSPSFQVHRTPGEIIDQMIETAGEARPVMAGLTAARRSKILRTAAALLEERFETFCDLIISEAGKPLRYARGEVRRAVENLHFCADEARRIHGETLPLDAAANGAGKSGFYTRVPVGVVLAISPFNFPLNLALHKIGPAVAAGCPVIFKPSSLTPVTGIELARCFYDAGLPGEGLSVVTGSGRETGDILVRDRRIRKISFTGSLAVGSHIVREGGLKKVTMELGSNSAVLIDEGAKDLDRIVDRCLTGAFAYQGQVCISIQRIYVHRSLYPDFQERFMARARQLKSGDPRKETTDIGPMISEEEAIRVMDRVKEAVSSGARAETGNHRNGVMLQPTVLTGVTEEMRVMKEEVFGPVVSLVPVESFEEGMERCNHSRYGLQAGVFTPSLDRALAFADGVDAGGIIINDIPTFRVDHMPYGGNRDSGLGREGTRFAIEEMTQPKMVVIHR